MLPTSSSSTQPGPRLALLAGAALLSCALLAPANAQTAPAATPEPTRPAVTVTAKRVLEDPSEFLASESRVLGRKFASSCNFMSAYNPYDDDLAIDYLRHFHGAIEETGVISDISPLGNASKQRTTTGADLDLRNASRSEPMDPAVQCSKNDRRFAAARNRIARKDKTLNLALAAYGRGDYAEAQTQFKTNYRKLANEFSALMLGRMYLEGKGATANTGEAVAWLEKVVNRRFGPDDRMRFDPKHPELMNVRAEAAMTLAKIYLLGHGVPRDARKARDYYELAHDAGYLPAAAMLGTGYLSGFAGERNPAKAVSLFQEAAEGGYAPAQYQLGSAYYHGDGVSKDWKMAGAYFVSAAKAGHAGAQLAAARMYDFGESVAPDQQRAIGYYKDAAVKGVPAAQNALGTYFYKGEVVAKNLDTARKLFNAAAMQAQPDAMYNLAIMNRDGEGGAQDLTMAYVWFSLAKAKRYPDAELALADVRPLLSPAELARADAILKPASAARQVQ
ncbi:MAG: tetratricopeptide repeat protein [Duganella sp.]